MLVPPVCILRERTLSTRAKDQRTHDMAVLHDSICGTDWRHNNVFDIA